MYTLTGIYIHSTLNKSNSSITTLQDEILFSSKAVQVLRPNI